MQPTERGGARSSALDPSDWADFTSSPAWTARAAPQLPGCAGYELGLMEVAAAVAERRSQEAQPLEPAEILARLRSAGSPHVWPRIWTLEAKDLTPQLIEERWSSWLSALPSGGNRRCGVAQARSDAGRQHIAAVVVEPLADLEPVPSRARLGQWLRLHGRASELTRSAKVVMLGPQGLPKAAPTTLAGGEFRSVFSLDQVGLWRVQVNVDTELGPRPALEAWVFVEVKPDFSAALGAAPGERALKSSSALETLRDAVLDMVNVARHSEQLPPLKRDARLDLLAQRHAEAVRQKGQAAHDVGDGSPLERVVSSGYPALRVAENVAQARDLGLAHRALWNSASHRNNLLDARFDLMGVGVFVESPETSPRRAGPRTLEGAPSHPIDDTLRDALHEAPSATGGASSTGGGVSPGSGRVWVCQIFVDSAPIKTEAAAESLQKLQRERVVSVSSAED